MPLFCHPLVHCHCSLSSRVVRYAAFRSKRDFLSVDIIGRRSVQKELLSFKKRDFSGVDFKVYKTDKFPSRWV